MIKFIAQFLSVVLHPIFIPIIALFIIFHSDSYLNYDTNEDAKPTLYLFVFLLTVVMPGLSTFILVRNKMISSIRMPHREERTGPYSITIFYYILLYYLLQRIDRLPPVMLSMVLGAIISLLLVTIINSKIKISAHTAGISGLIGIYMGLSTISVIALPEMYLVYGLIMLFGILAAARLYLEAHRPIEIYLGAIIGFVSEYFVIVWKLYI